MEFFSNWSAFQVDFIGDCIKLIEKMFGSNVNILNLDRTTFLSER